MAVHGGMKQDWSGGYIMQTPPKSARSVFKAVSPSFAFFPDVAFAKSGQGDDKVPGGAVIVAVHMEWALNIIEQDQAGKGVVRIHLVNITAKESGALWKRLSICTNSDLGPEHPGTATKASVMEGISFRWIPGQEVENSQNIKGFQGWLSKKLLGKGFGT